jgi:hypothetical protein
MLLIAASLFFSTPAPLEMPRAQAFLVREGKKLRLEDRYDANDLWLSRAVDGCWTDDAGREFLAASLATVSPMIASAGTETRVSYGTTAAPAELGEKGELARHDAIVRLNPVATAAKFAKPRQPIRGLKEVRYYNGTNASAIACAYLPEKASAWRFASWTLAPDDIYDDALETFEKEFLARRDVRARVEIAADYSSMSERELLRADARHSVAAYPKWHVTDSDEFVVLDDLAGSRDFIVPLTNDLKAMRRTYAQTVPSPVDGSNVLAVARIFADRAEYLAALALNDREDMSWSAAYWNPSRRELVACLSPDGSGKLLRTIRHEAFHQYLSYASAMIPAAPWFNEGYAQYFEGGPDGRDVADPADLALLADRIVPLLRMDYDEFYGGTDEERRIRYRLAISIAYFLEKGAPKVRFQPFKDVKRDYMSALLEMRDMHRATAAAFKDEDTLMLFVSEWQKFWENM